MKIVKCWVGHNVVPEMNHNELLGWRTNVENLAWLFTSITSRTSKRNQVRMDINKKDYFQIYIKHF